MTASSQLLGFSVDSMSGVRCDLILVLRSFGTFPKYALKHPEAARSEKMKKGVFFIQKRLTMTDLFEGR